MRELRVIDVDVIAAIPSKRLEPSKMQRTLHRAEVFRRFDRQKIVYEKNPIHVRLAIEPVKKPIDSQWKLGDVEIDAAPVEELGWRVADRECPCRLSHESASAN